MALDDYFSDPSQDCLARLFDAVNAMDLSGAPTFTRQEKLVMRSSERADIFAERFSQQSTIAPPAPSTKVIAHHKPTNSTDSYSSFEEGLLLRNKEKDKLTDEGRLRRIDQRERAESDSQIAASPPSTQSPSDSSFSLGGSVVWVGEEGEAAKDRDELGNASSTVSAGSYTSNGSSKNRKSIDASSSSSHALGKEQTYRPIASQLNFAEPQLRPGIVKDTRIYHTTVAYRDHQLPIKMPLSTFPEEVGDVSAIFSIVMRTALLTRISTH